MALRQFWQQVDPNTGTLVHDFTDPAWNTRFLGDLYQDLSRGRPQALRPAADARVRRGVHPRPHADAGHPRVRLPRSADDRPDLRLRPLPAGRLPPAGRRMAARHEPARNRARHRADRRWTPWPASTSTRSRSRSRASGCWWRRCKVSGVHRLTEAPDFKINVAIGDSLLHGKRFGMTATEGMFEGAEHYAGTGLAHAYASEDLAEVQRILGRQYHAVVGNPPYIIVKDAALNAAYRQRYASCHMKYSLGVPFTERFFELALYRQRTRAGGLRRADHRQLLHEARVRQQADRGGAAAAGPDARHRHLGRLHPGPRHADRDPVRAPPRAGGRRRYARSWASRASPARRTIRRRGWSGRPSSGRSTVPGRESEFVSVADTPRATFAKHPWSIGGGGAAD